MQILSILTTKLRSRGYYYFHLPREKTKAWGSRTTCPGPQNQKLAGTMRQTQAICPQSLVILTAVMSRL